MLNDAVNFIDPFGLEEGSAENLRKRADIARIAEGYIGSTKWAKSAERGAWPAGEYKCNQFVCQVTRWAEAPININDPGRWSSCPQAAEIANKTRQIDQWRVLKRGEKPQPGDIAAYEERGIGYTGHTGIVTEKGIVAARWDQVGLPFPRQFRGVITYRRYTGN